ncbi:50S ribosomal protein L25/general stress protein Ctc [Smaragdicoccus niigatensis]|uniref:50S ribosomal protein L25/general stress protein Ctc n=1 Tax=Smaragdicoccus niigatensis TaxID=359359 RepID=UPI000373FFFB|nr:50S ribosomal protein L25/general stress protein Ctc [Smaragdicoccus niigatensis]
MSEANVLEATVRTEFGKGAARRARAAGQVPAVLYGHGTEPQHLAVSARDFAAILRANGVNAVLSLQIDGKSQLALTKSVVVHPLRRYIEHADLLVLKKGERVTVDVQVVVVGEAVSGTLVTTDANTVSIEADALKVPQQLEINIEGAEAGTQFLAGQLELPDGAVLAGDPEALLVNVVVAPKEEEPEAAEGEEAEAAEGEAAEAAEGETAEAEAASEE